MEIAFLVHTETEMCVCTDEYKSSLDSAIHGAPQIPSWMNACQSIGNATFSLDEDITKGSGGKPWMSA